MPDNKTRQLIHRSLWGVAILIGLGALGAIGFDLARRAGAMRPATTVAATVGSAPAGAHLKVVAILENSAGPDSYLAQLLESRDGSDYRQAPGQLRIALSADTSIVMGTAADLKAGAVVQASGAVDGAHTLQARQIVILSGLVRVLPDR